MIDKKMTFTEIIEKEPEAIEILFKKGMHCIGCGAAAFETLEEGALAHGINPDKLVAEINKKFEKKDKKPKKKTKKKSARKTIKKPKKK